MSVVIVDKYGKIAGVYLDEFVSELEGLKATRGMFSKHFDYNFGDNYLWYAQVEKLANQIKFNQGINQLSLYNENIMQGKQQGEYKSLKDNDAKIYFEEIVVIFQSIVFYLQLTIV